MHASFSNNSIEIDKTLSFNKITKRKNFLLLDESWKKSKFVICYNYYAIENRNIDSLKSELRAKKGVFFKVFKNSLIRRLVTPYSSSDKIVSSLNIKGNNLLIFSDENSDFEIFEALSLIRKLDEEFSSEVYGVKKTSEINFEDRLNWAFNDHKFEDSSKIVSWSKLPSKENLFKELIRCLTNNLIFLIISIEKIIQIGEKKK